MAPASATARRINTSNCPLVVAGRSGGRIKTGRHLQCAEGTPLANLWLTQATALGVERERYADSTGVIPEVLA